MVAEPNMIERHIESIVPVGERVFDVL